MPTYLYVQVTRGCVCAESFKRSASFHVLVWPLRWIFSTLALPFYIGQPILLGYLVGTQVSAVAGVLSAVVFLGATIVGFVYMRQNSFLQRRLPKMDLQSYSRGLGEGWIDLLAFFCFLVATMGVVRVPYLLFILPKGDLGRSRRADLFLQALMTFYDYISIMCLLGVVMVFWRLPGFCKAFKEVKAKKRNAARVWNSVALHSLPIEYFFTGLCDIPFWIMGCMGAVLAVWYIPSLWRKLKTQKDMEERRTACTQCFVAALQDWFTFPFAILALGLVYRAYPLLRDMITNAETASRRRWLVFRELGYYAIDFFCFALPFLFLCAIPIRLYTWWRCVVARQPRWTWGFSFNATGFVPTRKCPRVECGGQLETLRILGMMLRDLPFIVIAVFLLATWRGPFMLYDVHNARTGSEKRKVVLRHFGWLFVDLLDTPFLIMILIMTVTVWRAPTLFRELQKAIGRPKRRTLIMAQFRRWLVDIPAFFSCLFVFVTIYRSRSLYRSLKAIRKEKVKILRQNVSDVTPHESHEYGDAEDNPPPESAPAAMDWHKVAFRELGLCLLDLPFPFLAMLTMWRLPWLIKKVIHECDTAMERRVAVVHYLFLVVKDIPCFVLAILLLLSWRSLSLIRRFRRYERGDSEHKIIVGEFWEVLIDTPYVLMGLLTFWRLPSLIMTIYRESFFVRPDKPSVRERRSWAALHFLLVFLDVFFATLVLIEIVTLIRLPTFVGYYRDIVKHGKGEVIMAKTEAFYKAAGFALWQLVLDIIYSWFFVVILCFVFFVPHLLVRMYRMTKAFMVVWKGERKQREEAATEPQPSAPVGSVEADALEAPTAPPPSETVHPEPPLGAGGPILLPFVEEEHGPNHDDDENENDENDDAAAAAAADADADADDDGDDDDTPHDDETMHVPAPQNPSEEHVKSQWGKGAWDDYSEGRDCMASSNEVTFFISPSFYRMVILFVFFDSVRVVPQIFMLPFKIAGYAFYPLHFFVKRRLGRAARWRDEVAMLERSKEYRYRQESMSFLWSPLDWLNAICVPRMSIWGMEHFCIFNIATLLLVLPNELGLLIMMINIAFVFVATLGSPLWKTFREDMKWRRLGGAPLDRPFAWALDTILVLVQVVTTPVFFLLQFYILITPLLLFAYLEYDTKPDSFRDVVTDVFRRRFWDHVPSVPWYGWLLQAYWVIITLATWHFSIHFTAKHFDVFDPLKAYYWLWDRVTKGVIWRFYKMLLEKATRFCYLTRNLCFIGELLMFPMLGAWSGWPLLLPFVVGTLYLLIACIPVSLFLVWRAWFIILENWTATVKKVDLTPLLVLNAFTPRFLDYGIRLEIQGTMSERAPHVHNMRLSLVGDGFWDTAAAVVGKTLVGAFKWTFHPITLVPGYADETELNQVHVDFHMDFLTSGKERVKKKILVRRLEAMLRVDNPPLCLLLEYGSKSLVGFNVEGVYLCVHTTLGDFAAASHAGKNLLIEAEVDRWDDTPPAGQPVPDGAGVGVDPPGGEVELWRSRSC